jgi:hypothetical protein
MAESCGIAVHTKMEKGDGENKKEKGYDAEENEKIRN